MTKNNITAMNEECGRIIRRLRLSVAKLQSEEEARAAFLDCVMTHFLSDRQCDLLGRIPTSRAYAHFDAFYRKLHFHNYISPSFLHLWIAKTQIISSLEYLITCNPDRVTPAVCEVYNKITALISERGGHVIRKERNAFLSAVLPILCYYIGVAGNPCLQCPSGKGSGRMFSKKRDNAKRLANLLTYAVSESDSHNVLDNNALFSLIKLLADKMVLDGACALLTTNKNPTYPRIEDFFMRPNHKLNPLYGVEKSVYKAFYLNIQNVDVEISLAKDPVLTFPWNHGRLVSTLNKIATQTNPWRQDALNHFAKLILPMGVMFVYNGLHSTFAGIIKRDGMLSINGESDGVVVDISELYSLLRFDGTNYVIAGSDIIAGTAQSFEFGCIFEIGRLLYEKGVCFKDLNKK